MSTKIFSKRDKKSLRNLIPKAVNRDIAAFLKSSLSIHQNLLSDEEADIRDSYWDLYEKFKGFSKDLNQKYDRGGHRDIPLQIATSLADDLLKEKDLGDFSEDGQQKLSEMVERIKKLRNA